jgi:hypothetical protein
MTGPAIRLPIEESLAGIIVPRAGFPLALRHSVKHLGILELSFPDVGRRCCRGPRPRFLRPSAVLLRLILPVRCHGWRNKGSRDAEVAESCSHVCGGTSLLLDGWESDRSHHREPIEVCASIQTKGGPRDPEDAPCLLLPARSICAAEESPPNQER